MKNVTLVIFVVGLLILVGVQAKSNDGMRLSGSIYYNDEQLGAFSGYFHVDSRMTLDLVNKYRLELDLGPDESSLVFESSEGVRLHGAKFLTDANGEKSFLYRVCEDDEDNVRYLSPAPKVVEPCK